MALEQESFLEASRALRAAALCLGSIPDPLWVQVGPGGGLVVIGTLLSDQILNRSAEFLTLVVLNHSQSFWPIF